MVPRQLLPYDRQPYMVDIYSVPGTQHSPKPVYWDLVFEHAESESLLQLE